MKKNPTFDNLCPRCGGTIIGLPAIMPLMGTISGIHEDDSSPPEPHWPEEREYCSMACLRADEDDGHVWDAGESDRLALERVERNSADINSETNLACVLSEIENSLRGR